MYNFWWSLLLSPMFCQKHGGRKKHSGNDFDWGLQVPENESSNKETLGSLWRNNVTFLECFMSNMWLWQISAWRGFTALLTVCSLSSAITVSLCFFSHKTLLCTIVGWFFPPKCFFHSFGRKIQEVPVFSVRSTMASQTWRHAADKCLLTGTLSWQFSSSY